MKPPITPATTLDFGKHKGSTVRKVLQDDPCYLEWCLDNVTGFAERMDTKLQSAIRACAEDFEDEAGPDIVR